MDMQVLRVKDLQWKIFMRQGLMVLTERWLVSLESLMVSLSLSLRMYLCCVCMSIALSLPRWISDFLLL